MGTRAGGVVTDSAWDVVAAVAYSSRTPLPSPPPFVEDQARTTTTPSATTSGDRATVVMIMAVIMVASGTMTVMRVVMSAVMIGWMAMTVDVT